MLLDAFPPFSAKCITNRAETCKPRKRVTRAAVAVLFR
jgi:hypothetical protein